MNRDTDPRLTGEYVRRLSGSTGEVTLVGVVHDHPASKYRVRELVETMDPEMLALELPPIAVPLYEQYADDERRPPAFGGEMSTAVQAATTDHVVGIDGPSPRFISRLLADVVTETDPRESFLPVVRSLAGVTKQAAVCRVGAAVAERTGLRLEVDPPATHDCAWTDDPDTQASDEQARVKRAQTISEMFEQPDTVRIRKQTRDRHMASRLASLREGGDIVAVVGIAHLDPIADRLDS